MNPLEGFFYSEEAGKPVGYTPNQWRDREPERLAPNATDPLVRFLRFVEVDPQTHCWEWRGNKRSNGYGQFRLPDAGVSAHRWIWQDAFGPLERPLTIHHTCENPGCVYLGHLVPMTLRDNLMSSDTPARRNALKTVCPRCDGDYSRTARGYRKCKPCEIVQQRERRRSRRASLRTA